ncbi:glycosyltransferase [Dyadobacter aurulentus]|uniref:glycosyltransferase n=1 Tax=Dyadobacter sp. UC 10 TaxID=2605428 RepID=UPI0011F1D48C|nr:glycosyltransferase [Dyadobacter sp. UC 10]KAA0990503.1 glycosyltransferase family 4 protein [Dyadobacter sp. UC 10]
MKRILLLSTVHPPTDPRIFYKIAPALAEKYEVICVTPGAPKISGNTFKSYPVPFFKKLLPRILVSHPAVLWKCLVLRPDMVHIFVPELIPVALVLQCFGIKIVYEVQENLYKKFSIKTYNNGALFKKLFRYFDDLARQKFRLIFTEKAYLNEYSEMKYPFSIIQNFAKLQLIDSFTDTPKKMMVPEFFYTGVISIERSFDVMVAAFSELKIRYPYFHLHLFGPVRISDKIISTLPGFNHIRENLTFYGYSDQRIAFRNASGCIAGIALLKPVGDYPDSYTTKLFEYMALKLPVITSDFPSYREIVEPSQSGFCICPYNSKLLLEKLVFLIENEKERSEMGKRGRACVENYYNWQTECEKLLAFYASIVSPVNVI